NTPPNTTFNQSVVISGKDFSPNAVAWVNPPCDSLGFRKAVSTVRNSATQIIATIPIRCAGTYSLEVENPQPGGGSAALASFAVPSDVILATFATVTVSNPLPVITSVYRHNVLWISNPPPTAAFNQSVVISGTNFSSNAVAWVNPPCDNLGFRKAIS